MVKRGENVVANALLRGELRPDNLPTLKGIAGSFPGPSKVVDRGQFGLLDGEEGEESAGLCRFVSPSPRHRA
jgi:hypothetical protein